MPPSFPCRFPARGGRVSGNVREAPRRFDAALSGVPKPSLGTLSSKHPHFRCESAALSTRKFRTFQVKVPHIFSGSARWAMLFFCEFSNTVNQTFKEKLNAASVSAIHLMRMEKKVGWKRLLTASENVWQSLPSHVA